MKILVGLSGGVDSAVSAYLLKQAGYEVHAGFMVNYTDPANPHCSTRQDLRDARMVASFLDIPFYTFDFREIYEQEILSYLYNGYKQGITPNPDFFCNNLIKFGIFLEKALEMGFDKIATGHYARIEEKAKNQQNGYTYNLLRGKDKNKDQSYFLAGLTQFQLSKTIFPVGNLTKQEVRTIARQVGLPNAERKDSQGLCFVGNVPMRKFLAKKIPQQPGDIVDTSGKKIGTHQGAWYFTLGQNQGLGLHCKAYVVAVDVQKNLVVVTKDKNDPALYTTKILLQNWHVINEENKCENFPFPISYKIRYRQEPRQGKLFKVGKEMRMYFDSPERGVPPGQIAVAYDGDTVVGSGVIAKGCSLHE